eukprot:TRINITY_DN633_c0_g1_i2.p1 TRINITY_DN633_c0_g1~~TRINITY_DN633_c0_g1_i2.p1  ORF type:complete len:124 (-),score=5.35 TRINITY_DN633_c0_g1_i2:560-931(-)
MSFGSRSSLLDLEAGTAVAGNKSIAATSLSREATELENEKSLGELEERARLIKQLTRDIHREVESQNKVLEGMGIEMDTVRRLLSGTADRFRKVFENKNTRNLSTAIVSCVGLVFLLYFLMHR